ncbi:hypothetical protein [Fictibacillus terranigra]|uniref:Uncharacterized protein n=1 Tax=Fictibacillus terranigra TaxID=3058424 RepID=A0ABT8E8W3_9BACL|nr:hypothetical protein [Fictibacillus sp. CENA-BCM004]MDN4074349.1 hypothetical protein [Fictibacillus sp. CENA-BCM004]
MQIDAKVRRGDNRLPDHVNRMDKLLILTPCSSNQ